MRGTRQFKWTRGLVPASPRGRSSRMHGPTTPLQPPLHGNVAPRDVDRKRIRAPGRCRAPCSRLSRPRRRRRCPDGCRHRHPAGGRRGPSESPAGGHRPLSSGVCGSRPALRRRRRRRRAEAPTPPRDCSLLGWCRCVPCPVCPPVWYSTTTPARNEHRCWQFWRGFSRVSGRRP